MILAENSNILLYLAKATLSDHLNKALEQIARIARARRCLGVVLHGEDALDLAGDAFVGAVEQRDMRDLDALGQDLSIHGETVILGGDLHLAGGEILDRLVGAAMAALQLVGLARRSVCASNWWPRQMPKIGTPSCITPWMAGTA